MKVLVIKVNQLGDNVVFLPVVQALISALGPKEVSLLTSPVAEPLYRGLLPAENILVAPTATFLRDWKRPLSLLRWLLRVRRLRPTAVLVASDQGNFAHLLALGSGARWRLGYASPWIKVPGSLTEALPLIARELAGFSNWRLLKAWAQVARIDVPAAPPPPDLSHLRRPAKPFDVIIHAGASREYQRWPRENFQAVARELLASGYSVGWIAAPDETDHGAYTVVKTPQLEDLISVIASARLFLGNNSGPMNLAVAQGVPSVILNGPSNPTWDPSWHPERHVFLRDLTVTCVPCDDDFRGPAGFCTNPDKFKCLRVLTPEIVTRICKDRLAVLDSAAMTEPAK